MAIFIIVPHAKMLTIAIANNTTASNFLCMCATVRCNHNFSYLQQVPPFTVWHAKMEKHLQPWFYIQPLINWVVRWCRIGSCVDPDALWLTPWLTISHNNTPAPLDTPIQTPCYHVAHSANSAVFQCYSQHTEIMTQSGFISYILLPVWYS